MCKITATEFKRNFGKYMTLGQHEVIEVTRRGKTIFKIVPQQYELMQEWEHFFGTLPNEAYDDKEISRE